ncbi:hypothetical protein [Nostoc punctiforme]|uniref:hypothetical protein n=1 Tax=Nostoc punctiforme TaxID=272131 RepID=UPI001F352F28|nr:hypothetical protein [Nostoc punctiforme]
MTIDSLQLPDLPLIALVAGSEAMPQAYRLRSSSVWVLVIASSIAVAGIAISIALSTSPLRISGDINEKSLRCTILNFLSWEQSLIYMTLSLN